MNLPLYLPASGRSPASGVAHTSKILLVRFIMAVFILLPTTTPAGLIAAEFESILRRVTK